MMLLRCPCERLKYLENQLHVNESAPQVDCSKKFLTVTDSAFFLSVQLKEHSLTL